MGLLNQPGRDARAQMEEAEKLNTRGAASAPEVDSEGKPRPKRYKLYDRIAANVSVNTMNIIITVTVVLLVAALVYGIITGTPQP